LETEHNLDPDQELFTDPNLQIISDPAGSECTTLVSATTALMRSYKNLPKKVLLLRMNYSQKMNLNFHENKIRHLSYKNPNAKRETIKPSRKRRK
jgi:hypothetical protein